MPPLMKQFAVLCYRDDKAVYLPAGNTVFINCDHANIQACGINMNGEIVPLPPNISPQPPTSPPSSPPSVIPQNVFAAAQDLIPPGNVYNSTTFFGDSGFKAAYKIKDMVTLREYIVDQVSYNTNVIYNCNPAPYVTSCAIPTGLVASAIGATTATISWAAIGSAAGFEWVNSTVNSTPAGDGTYSSTNSVSLTGLTASTTYYFFVRQICIGGLKSSWVSVSFVTT